MSDFEERTGFLLRTLLSRGYEFRFLRREFCKAIERYISEFQRWAIPLNFRNWFDDLFRGNLPNALSNSII